MAEEQLQLSRQALRESYEEGNEDGASVALANQQATEQVLRELNATLARAKAMSRFSSDDVELGSTVHLKTDNGERVFTLVDTREVDPLANRISPESPLGQLLMGHHTGDQVVLEVQGVKLHFTINSIE